MAKKDPIDDETSDEDSTSESEEVAKQQKKETDSEDSDSDDDDSDSDSEENTKTEDKVRVPAVCWRASRHSAPKAALGRTAAARLCLAAGRGSAAAAPL